MAPVPAKLPQNEFETQLERQRSRWHLPMATCAAQMGLHTAEGDPDTKALYENLFETRKCRDASHSGEMELGAHCDVFGDKIGARHEYPWFFRFRVPGCDKAYDHSETFPALLGFDVREQLEALDKLRADDEALRVGLLERPPEPGQEMEALQRFHELAVQLEVEHPNVFYFAKHSTARANKRELVESFRMVLKELIDAFLLEDPRSRMATCPSIERTPSPVIEPESSPRAELPADSAPERSPLASSESDEEEGDDGWGDLEDEADDCVSCCPTCESKDAVSKVFRCKRTVGGTGGSGKKGAGAGAPPRTVIDSRVLAFIGCCYERRIPERQMMEVLKDAASCFGIEPKHVPSRSSCANI